MERERGRIGGRKGGFLLRADQYDERVSTSPMSTTQNEAFFGAHSHTHMHTHTHRRYPRGLDLATTTLPITSILLMRSGRGLLMRITFKWTCPRLPLFPLSLPSSLFIPSSASLFFLSAPYPSCWQLTYRHGDTTNEHWHMTFKEVKAELVINLTQSVSRTHMHAHRDTKTHTHINLCWVRTQKKIWV